ncbi:hypothetical protein Pmar_PMAR022699, partial [Perkinsus marinus ATCC 50983]
DAHVYGYGQFQAKLEKERVEQQQCGDLVFEDPMEDEFEKDEKIDGDAASDASEMAATGEEPSAGVGGGVGGTAVYGPGVDKVEEGIVGTLPQHLARSDEQRVKDICKDDNPHEDALDVLTRMHDEDGKRNDAGNRN